MLSCSSSHAQVHNAHTHLRTHTHAQAHTQARTHLHRRTHTYTHMHKRTHTGAHTHTRTHAQARTHTRTHTHTQTHTHTHTNKLAIAPKEHAKLAHACSSSSSSRNSNNNNDKLVPPRVSGRYRWPQTSPQGSKSPFERGWSESFCKIINSGGVDAFICKIVFYVRSLHIECQLSFCLPH